MSERHPRLVLRLSLERLVTDFNNVPVKLADSVSFPLELDMAPYLPAAVRCTMNGSKTMYDCYAVGVHLCWNPQKNNKLNSQSVYVLFCSREVHNIIAILLSNTGVHRGGADEGHYYAYCRDFMLDKWFEFNDRRVQNIHPGVNCAPNAFHPSRDPSNG